MIDKMVNDIKNQTTNGSPNELTSNILDGDKKDLIFEDNNIIYQLTLTENQENNENINMPTINLGECEEAPKKRI